MNIKHTMNPSQAKVEVIHAIAEAIRDATQAVGGTPSGHLYAALMTTGMTLDFYQDCLGVLKRAGLFKEDPSHFLRWVGTQSEGEVS